MDLDTSLQIGLTRRNEHGHDIAYRFLSETDDIESITDLLHRAYAPLARAGMRYVASYQSSDTTRRRIGKGETIVAVADKKVIGELALDTSEHAAHLIRFYSSRGYRFIEFTQWPDVNYRSMVFGKPVAEIRSAL